MTGFLDSCAFTSTLEVIRAGNKDGLRRWITGRRDRPVSVKSQNQESRTIRARVAMDGRAPTSPPDVGALRAAVTNPTREGTLGVGKRIIFLIHTFLISTLFQLSDGFVHVFFFFFLLCVCVCVCDPSGV